jgi:hypothetical protein
MTASSWVPGKSRKTAKDKLLLKSQLTRKKLPIHSRGSRSFRHIEQRKSRRKKKNSRLGIVSNSRICPTRSILRTKTSVEQCRMSKAKPIEASLLKVVR